MEFSRDCPAGTNGLQASFWVTTFPCPCAQFPGLSLGSYFLSVSAVIWTCGPVFTMPALWLELHLALASPSLPGSWHLATEIHFQINISSAIYLDYLIFFSQTLVGVLVGKMAPMILSSPNLHDGVIPSSRMWNGLTDSLLMTRKWQKGRDVTSEVKLWKDWGFCPGRVSLWPALLDSSPWKHTAALPWGSLWKSPPGERPTVIRQVVGRNIIGLVWA